MALERLVQDARAASREVIRLSRDPALFVWALYLLLVPVYVINSGLPQPGDWLILVLWPLAKKGRARPPASTLLVRRVLVLFVGYVVLLNLVWSAALGNWAFSPRTGFLMSPLFYVYNAIMFVIVLNLYQRYRERFLWFTAKLVFASLVMQVAISAILVAPGLRVQVLFNNSNQLGFFALLSASLLFLLQRRKHVSSLEVTVGMVSAVYLCLLSASKAALGSIALLALFGAVVRFRTMLVVAVVIVLSLTVDNPINDAVNRTLTRFQTDTSHGTVEERGYDRIINNPEYVIIGSGEGDYLRFKDTTVIGSHEIHSSLGTLIFCYGITGLLLFTLLIWLVLRGSGFRTWLLVAPSFAYSMTHQGLRFTSFWVLLALVVAMRCEMLAVAARARAQRLKLERNV